MAMTKRAWGKPNVDMSGWKKIIPDLEIVEGEDAMTALSKKPKKKLSGTQQWMLDHPNDVPCPRSSVAAAAWRRKRGL
jgi:hypothetical protein